ncbi:MAG: AraC family transcriptional regulator [Spirochaetaceae bacterium]|nr:AraC family transcriptional regulator [Spirochaetaceae bacterium]
MRLPVSIYKDGERIIPKKGRPSANLIVNGQNSYMSIKESIKQGENIQYLQNIYYENFICLVGEKGYLVLVGPLKKGPIRRGEVKSLVRRQLVSYHNQSLLLNYYASLQTISESQYYMSGKLIQKLMEGHLKRQRTTNIDSDASRSSGDIENGAFIFSHSPYYLEQKITKLISGGDTEEARNVLSLINKHKKAHLAKNDLRSHKNSLICDCTFMTRAAIAGGVNPEVAFFHSDLFIREIESEFDIARLKKLELRIINELTSLVKETKQNKYSQTVRSVMDYIISHLKEKITLTVIADTLFINASYLSGLFSKEVGFTMNHYIKASRVAESKWDLCYTNNTVVNIASIYQFSSQSYYISCFKDITGETPLKYRRRHTVV